MHKKIIIPLSCLIFSSAMAQNNPLNNIKKINYFVGFDLGLAYNHIKKNKAIPAPITGLSDQQFNTNRGQNIYFRPELKAGISYKIASNWQLQNSIEYNINDAQRVRGQYFLRPTAPSQTYQFDVSIQSLMFNTNLFYSLKNNWSYFIGGGIGAARINSSAAIFTPIISGGRPVPLATKSNTKINFAYSINLGIGYKYSNNDTLLIGLRQAWLGRQIFTVNDGVLEHNIDNGCLHPTLIWIGINNQI